MQGESKMNDVIGEPVLVRQYLLGTLNDDVALSQIEMQLMSDDKFADQLTLHENDLIEEYLDGRLNDLDSANFIRHFLASPERRRQLRLTQNLLRYAAVAPREVPRAKRSLFDWNATRSFQWLRFAALAGVVFAALFGFWRYFIYESPVDQSLAQLRIAFSGQRPIEPRISAFPDYVPFYETRGPEEKPTDQAALDRAQVYLLESSKDPGNSQAHRALGLVLLTQKKYEKALVEFELALSSSPNDPFIRSDIGAAYLAVAQWKEGENDGAKFLEYLNDSLRHLDLAISIDPKMPEPRFNRALALEELKSREEAKKAWHEYLEVDPNSKWADEARRHLEKLESSAASELSANDLERNYLDAVAGNNEDAAWHLLSGNRELIREKYLPQRLAMSYLNAEFDRRDELLRALRYTGDLEIKHTGDPFAKEIALFYANIPAARQDILRLAHADVLSGYRECFLQKYGSALPFFERARVGFESAGDVWNAALAQYFVGYATVNSENVDKALAEFEAVSAYARKRGYVWLEATVLYWCGVTNIKLDHHTASRRNHERGLALAERIGDSYAMQRNLVELGRLSTLGGQRKSALGYTYRLLKESDRRGTSVRQRLRNFSGITGTLSRLKLRNIAFPISLEAVATAQQFKDQLWEVVSLSNAGLAGVRLGRFAESQVLIDLSKEHAMAMDDEKSRQKMTAYADLALGELEMERGDLARSEASYRNAADYYKTSAMPYQLAKAEKGLLMTSLARKNVDDIQARLSDNIEIGEKYRTEIFDESEKTGFFDQDESIYDIAADFEFGRGEPERAYDYAEMSSSRALLDWLQMGISVESTQQKRSILISDSAVPFNLVRIREQMPAVVQIIQYSVLDEKLLIWLVSRDKFIARTVAITKSELANKVSEYARLIGSKNTGDEVQRSRLDRELYNLLIGPVIDELDRDRDICFVPAKMIFSVPFAALVSPAGRPLIADHNIFYAPSANVFLHLTARAAAKSQISKENLLAIGDPAFDRREFDDLPYLSHARDEIKLIVPNYIERRVLTGENATRSEVVKAMPDANIIHFAGHYVVAPEAPMESYLLLATDSGRREDSILTNIDLAGMDLAQTKLVILAACRSGVESYSNGEGLIGLSRTFMGADVPLVVASQWSVDSDATSVLMQRFHQLRRQEQLSTAEALRRAQLEMHGDATGRYSSPYSWAAFGVYGGYATY